MKTNKNDAKKRIMDATLSLIDCTENPDEITVREIARVAEVGTGLINYHYESRDSLISEAISMKLQSFAGVIEKNIEDVDNPLKYLKEILITMSGIAVKNSKLNRFSVEYDLLKGDLKTCLYLLPVLRKIYNGAKSETELRLLAFQIIVITQSIYLRQDAFYMLTGINIDSKRERDELLNSIVDGLIQIDKS